MSDTARTSLSIISALTAAFGLFGAFLDIRVSIALFLAAGIFIFVAFQKEFTPSPNSKTLLFTLALVAAFLAIAGVLIDIRVSVTAILISVMLALTALNTDSLSVKQVGVNIALFLVLIFSLKFSFAPFYLHIIGNFSVDLTQLLLIAFVVVAIVFANKNSFKVSQIIINIILFSILFLTLSALYHNPSHSLAWVSFIIFIIIAALVNRVGYNKANPKLPGFGISLGLSLTYMSLLILIPLSALALYSTQMPLDKFIENITDQRIITALKISFSASFIAALINCFFGLIIAWILTRYDFFGKRIIDSVIDLPFAVPTAVAGISLAYIFSPNGVLGKVLQELSEKLRTLAPYFSSEGCDVDENCFRNFLENIDINVAYSKTGIILALVFIGLPFIVRTVQPVIEELDKELEEAASSLGANFYQIFRKVIFPTIYPALLTGFALAFARGLGEYGSVIFISSNIPYESEIVPLLIVKKLMQFDYVGASVIGVIMLVAAFILLLLINFLQSFARRRKKGN
ncbi:MAG: ABC transporter permease subunit [Campylobacteraceae bacterium]|jgi:sulfate transport system permease protein|nr:ABC transporter permease subunit [Campylobacteraceae bacterium]